MNEAMMVQVWANVAIAVFSGLSVCAAAWVVYQNYKHFAATRAPYVIGYLFPEVDYGLFQFTIVNEGLSAAYDVHYDIFGSESWNDVAVTEKLLPIKRKVEILPAGRCIKIHFAVPDRISEEFQGHSITIRVRFRDTKGKQKETTTNNFPYDFGDTANVPSPIKDASKSLASIDRSLSKMGNRES